MTGSLLSFTAHFFLSFFCSYSCETFLTAMNLTLAVRSSDRTCKDNEAELTYRDEIEVSGNCSIVNIHEIYTLDLMFKLHNPL